MIIKILIYGKVTGVFFRFFVRQNAKRLNLKGFVKNINEHLELILEGDKKEVEEMIELCRKGPPGAVVENVEVKEISNYIGTFDDFEIIR